MLDTQQKKTKDGSNCCCTFGGGGGGGVVGLGRVRARFAVRIVGASHSRSLVRESLLSPNLWSTFTNRVMFCCFLCLCHLSPFPPFPLLLLLQLLIGTAVAQIPGNPKPCNFPAEFEGEPSTMHGSAQRFLRWQHQ